MRNSRDLSILFVIGLSMTGLFLGCSDNDKSDDTGAGHSSAITAGQEKASSGDAGSALPSSNEAASSQGAADSGTSGDANDQQNSDDHGKDNDNSGKDNDKADQTPEAVNAGEGEICPDGMRDYWVLAQKIVYIEPSDTHPLIPENKPGSFVIVSAEKLDGFLAEAAEFADQYSSSTHTTLEQLSEAAQKIQFDKEVVLSVAYPYASNYKKEEISLCNSGLPVARVEYCRSEPIDTSIATRWYLLVVPKDSYADAEYRMVNICSEPEE